MPKYLPRVIEPRWQQYWQTHRCFRTPDPGDASVQGKPKYYILDMFPYPSGAGLHVGHPEGYTATDILARFQRMRGFHVLHPMGWDAFGLPAEQHAIKTGEHPSINTKRNVDTFRRQIQSLGFSYDWDREVDTTDANYVHWTQWIFLQLFDTWYDTQMQKGRPIAELPIPEAIRTSGEDAIRRYQDGQRLAYQAEVPVNWCEALGTVLANEEVIDGKSEREGHPVTRRPLRQWLLRITAYAERLIDELEPLTWSDSIKKMQRDWIGRSEGAEVDFAVADGTGVIRVFTTRPDTLFGATYMVLAPEHELVDAITTPEQAEAVRRYRETAARKSDFERAETAKAKTGVFTGAFAINPVNGHAIPIWIADYVLGGYGTGAIMAVPAHDERDFAFATTYQLPIVAVVQPSESWLKKTKSTIEKLSEPYCEAGVAIQSDFLNGLATGEAKNQIIRVLEERGQGTRRINYKLRDWLFSRQRYWGEPFPILHEVNAQGERTGVMRPLSPDELPLQLPEMADFKPTGSPEGPLAKATDWIEVKRDGKTYHRETNTMPQWAGSCWYFLRYIDPKNATQFADPTKLDYWLPVDLYVGGAEHAVLHLLYSRFWHKVLFDRGYVKTPEPFQRLVNQGMILGEMEYHTSMEAFAPLAESLGEQGITSLLIEKDGQKSLVVKLKDGDEVVNLPDERIEKRKGKAYLKGTELELIGRADKMSKSRGNVVNPDDVVRLYGADSLRLYEMFMGPLEATKPWNMMGVEGVNRFLNRVWRLMIDDAAEATQLNSTIQDIEPDRELLTLYHYTIQKVGEDTEAMRFNTAIAAMMELTNHLTKLAVRPKSIMEGFVLLLAPYAPHLAEELWVTLGHTNTLTYESWPQYDPELIKADTIEVPVQVNGKIKSKLMVPAEIESKELEALALADVSVVKAMEGKTVKKIVVVPRKMVNIVVG